MTQNLFEDQQEQLECNVEQLSKVLATDVPALPRGDGFGRGMATAQRLGPRRCNGGSAQGMRGAAPGAAALGERGGDATQGTTASGARL